MMTRIAWMRGRTGVARHAERAALFRTAQNAADQNSAGRYPLISSPMQISTRVGVLQAIGRPFSAFLNEHVKSARAGAQSGCCRPESLLRRRLPGVAEGDRQVR